MIEVKYGYIPDKMFVNYFNFLVGRVFKILPISEEQPDTLRDYLNSLLIELVGSKELILKIRDDANFISLLSILQYLNSNECSHDEIRKEVFHCINIINKLQTQYDFE